MRNKRLASVQHHYIHAREVTGEVLSLVAPLSPTRRSYRMVLEVAPINFVLKADEEQIALLDRYAALFKALTFPVQILIRNQPLDLRPYLASLQAQANVFRATITAPATREPGEQDEIRWPDLADDLEALLKRLGSQHTLISRHCYLIIPAPDAAGPARRGGVSQKAARRARAAAWQVQALQELAVRVERLERQLQALGLRSRRLCGPELARFYHSCLTPDHALLHPLHDDQVQVAGRLPRVKRPSATATGWRPDAFSEAEAMDAAQSGGKLAANEATPGQRRQRWKRHHDQRRAVPLLPPSDVVPLADLLAPGSIQEFRDAVCVCSGIPGAGETGETWISGIAVTAFPREVSTSGWLAPLLLHDEIFDVVFHLHPQETNRMMRQLKQRRAGYASTRAFNRRYGRLDEPEMEVASADVLRMLSRLASGEERLFEVSLLVLVRASDRQTLAERRERVAALLQTVLLDAVAHSTTFEHGLALRSALPECADDLGRTLTLDTSSLATTFPFLSNALTMPGGVLLGATASGELALLDPWHASLENPHCLLCGVTGAGKSTTGKLWIERALLVAGQHGERIWVIDPDGEYLRLAHALGGEVVRLAPGSLQRLNPFDLVPPGHDLATYLQAVGHSDRLAEKVRDLRGLLEVMLAEHGSALSSKERAFLDRALYETYRRVGITADPRTHDRQPPLLRDLGDVLKSGVCGPDEFDLLLRLSPYTEGSLAGLFSGLTNVALDSHLLVWDIRDLGAEFFPVGIFLIADHVWTQAMYQSAVRRALYIDEAATLIARPAGGVFLADLSRRARKRYLRLVTMTQNPEQFVANEHGAVVAANAAIKILKRQDRTSVRAVATRFGLTRGEEERLLALAPSEALVLCGDRRVLLTSQVSPRELALMTTNPVELAKRRHTQQRFQPPVASTKEDRR